MSLARRFGVRNVFVSFGEILLFFALSYEAFRRLYLLAVSPDWVVPVWGWILAGVAYLVVLTVYWAPGEKEDSEAELQGLCLFLALAVVIGGTWLQGKYGAVSGAAKTFWEVIGPGK